MDVQQPGIRAGSREVPRRRAPGLPPGARAPPAMRSSRQPKHPPADRADPTPPDPGPQPPDQAAGLAFDDVYRQAYKPALRKARARLSRDDADDVVQEAATDLFDRWPALPPEQRTVAYFLGNVSFRILGAVRHDARVEAKRVDALDAIPAAFRDIDGRRATRSDAAEFKADFTLREMLQKLPERQRDAWSSVREDGWSPRQVAKRLHISEKTVRNHLARADAGLRKQLAEMGLRIELFANGHARRCIGKIDSRRLRAADRRPGEWP